MGKGLRYCRNPSAEANPLSPQSPKKTRPTRRRVRGRTARQATAIPLKPSPAGLDRENRTLRLIGGCNQALLRATDETELIKSICHILVDKGGYRMAWVGLAEIIDGEKRVRPVAHAGHTDGFLYRTKITWDESEFGRGPTGTAIRGGKPVFIHDITKDPDFVPWRKDVLQRGYASCISLPLKDRGEIFGAMTIYSLQVEAFDEREIEILAEMAGDLAYGIGALRIAAGHARLETELRASERQLNLILNNVSDIIFSISVEEDGGFRFAWANDRFLAATGLNKDQVVGLPVSQVIPEPAHALVFGKYREAIRTKKAVFWEEVSEYPAGKKYGQVTMVPVDDATGVCRHLIGLVHDATESRQAEEKLKESERKYRELVENANSVILRWTRDGRLTYLNEFGQKFFGYRAEEITGRNVIGTIVPETETSGRDLARLMDRILADPAAFEQNTNENMRRNGERVWIAWTNKIVRDEDGQVKEILSIGTDITARKKAEDEVRELNQGLEKRVADRTAELAIERDRAEAADRLKSAFLAIMSHELRTPLNSIIGFTGILLQQLAGPLNDEQRKQLGMVQESARHLLALINDVLDISKIEAGQMQVHPERFILEDSLRKAAGLVAPLAEKRGLELKLDIPPGLGEIVSDPQRVEQILINLLNNAVKFTPKGTVTLGAAVEGPLARVWVADTGMGIKREDFDKLFRSFQQIDTGLSRQHEGTGLGLAICKRLAGLLGGDIRLESEWGKGSRFTLTLPLERGARP